jgi:hypothetical protein
MDLGWLSGVGLFALIGIAAVMVIVVGLVVGLTSIANQ